MKRTKSIALALALSGLSLASSEQSPYRALSWAEVSSGQAAPGLVMARGRYLPSAQFAALVRGVLSDGRFSLPVEGAVFDWTPPAGALVEAWGALERAENGYRLRFHNARAWGDRSRAPRPANAAAIQDGSRARLWLKVTVTGSNPAPGVTGASEDGAVFALPSAYKGPFGVACLEGVVVKAGERLSLRDPVACP